MTELLSKVNQLRHAMTSWQISSQDRQMADAVLLDAYKYIRTSLPASVSPSRAVSVRRIRA